MPSDKYFGKSKEDLVLIAKLGLVLNEEQANAMSREELAEYLFKKDQEALMNVKKAKKTKIKEKKPLARKSRIKAEPSGKEIIQEEKQPELKQKPAKKLSKKELNKLLFLQEIASKSNEPIITATPADSEEPVILAADVKAVKKSGIDSTGKVKKPSISRKKTAADKTSKTIKTHKTEKTEKADKKAKTDKKAKAIKTRKTVKTPEEVQMAKPKEAAPAEEKPDSNYAKPFKGRKDAGETRSEGLSVSVDKLPEGIRQHLIITDKHHKLTTHAETDIDSGAESELDQEGEQKKGEKVPAIEIMETVEGALEIMPDGYGFLRKENYLQSPKDIYVPPQYIRRFNLRIGDWISGPGKLQRETDRYQAILYIKEVNGHPPEKMLNRPQFDKLTPIYPDEKFTLETGRNELSTRIIDLIAPIGKGQRGMIVSPPKAGKTILLQKIANAIAINNPETKLIVLLIDERPEEVTDMQRSINGEVVYSTFDKTPENHVKVVELVLERAMRLVELGKDVVILLDSITRLSRAYNLTINPTGRTLSGGLDPGALYGPKRFFGAARNIEHGGSLTIIATSLIETGSRMDEVIFEEFKGTGNMEVYLDRKLSEKRIFPAIDINRSGTRREELLLTKRELDAVWTIRKAFSQLDTAAVTEMIMNLLLKTNNNSHFVSSVNVSLNDKAMYDAMRGTKPGGAGNASANGSNSGNGNNYSNGGSY